MKRNNIVLSLLMGIFGGLIVSGFVLFYFKNHEKEEEQKNTLSALNVNGKDIDGIKTNITAYPTNYSASGQYSGYIDLSYAAQKSVDAVVHVTTINSRHNQVYSNPFFDFFFGNPGGSYNSRPTIATGSGVIISDDGFIVTNNHVIENADMIEIILNDKRTFEAKIIGIDAGTDIALLKIEETDLPFLKYGSSDSLKTGNWVLAVGNPFNLTSTVTAGIVSAKARNINIINKRYGIESFIQTDAAVNPGNSGGALVNTNGELVGINTAIASQTGSFTGYSFAIPISIVQKVVADLIEFGEVQRALLGVVMSDINAQLAQKYDLNILEGVFIQQTEQGSAAAKSGIKASDIITGIGTTTIKTVAEFQDQLSRLRPGQDIELTIDRKGKIIKIKTTLQNRIGNTSTIQRNDLVNLLGAYFNPISEKEAQRLGIKGGVEITDIENGKMLNAGIRKGFIITFINGKQVLSEQDIENIIKNTPNGGIYIEGIFPNGMRAYYAFGL